MQDAWLFPQQHSEPRAKPVVAAVGSRQVARAVRNVPAVMVARRRERTVSYEEPAQCRFWVCNRLEGRLILPKKKELSMSIGPISLLNNLCSSPNGAGDGNSSSAFKNAVRSLVMTIPGANPPASSYTPQLGTPRFQSTFYDPSMSTGGDDSLDNTVTSDESALQSLINKFQTTVNNDEAALENPPPAPADPSSADSSTPAANTPPDTSNWTPQQFLTALQNGTAVGNPPDNLTLPPGTTAADVANENGGLINNLNKLHIQNGTPAGDAAAQKYGYKDMKTLLADKSPQAAAAAGKILWAARASNNAPEQDGSARPAQEQSANTLSAVSSKHQASDGGTGGIFQQWLQGQNSIQNPTTKATSRTYADGGGKSNATIVGEKIAGVFKKVFSFICPPISDLIQTAEDGATKDRDASVGDKDAESHDKAALKQDGKNFGKDFGEFAANAALMIVPGAGEAALAARGVADVAETGAKDVAETGAKDAAETGAKDAAKDTAKSGDKDPASSASSLKNRLQNLGDDVKSKFADLPKNATPQEIKDYLKKKLQDLMFGDNFKSKLADLPKNPEQAKEYVKKKLKDHQNDLLQQLAPPPNGNPNANSSQEQQLAQMQQMMMILEMEDSASSSDPFAMASETL